MNMINRKLESLRVQKEVNNYRLYESEELLSKEERTRLLKENSVLSEEINGLLGSVL